jgi:hypothetical protein
MKKSLSFAIILVLFLTSCSSNTNEAEKSAKEWFLAVNKMESLKADSLVCNGLKDEFRQNLALNSALYLFAGQLIKDIKIEIDDSGIKYQTKSISNDEVSVSVSGEIRGSISGMVTSNKIDEDWKIVKEDGKWKWCGWLRGHTNLAKIPGTSSQTSNNVDPDKPAYQIIGYSISTTDAEKKPGWTTYNFKIGITSNSDKFQQVLFPNKNQLTITTTDGNTYDNGKFLERFKSDVVDDYNQLSLTKDYLFLLPPKAIIFAKGVGTGDWIDKVPKSFHIEFLIPSTLKPKTLTANNINPINWNDVQSKSIDYGDAVKNVPENYTFPYSGKNDSTVKFQISNPRATYEINQFSDKKKPVILMDIEVTNTDNASDQKFDFNASVIDGWGTIYTSVSTGCQGNDRDYKIESTKATTIGPSQTIKGSICIGLGLITDDALANGDYIINLNSPDGVGWFKVHLPFTEQTLSNSNQSNESAPESNLPNTESSNDDPKSGNNSQEENSKYQRATISNNVYFVNLRKSPGFASKDDKKDVVVVIPSGDDVNILSGPEIADGLKWWYAEWDGYKGWIAESKSSGGQILDFK